MIGILSQGRMGNQMFQYAFGYSLSKKLNTKFFIYKHNSLHYFKLNEELIKHNKKNILVYIFKNLFKKNKIRFSLNALKHPLNFCLECSINKNIYKCPNTIDNGVHLLLPTKNNCLYEGFFQSEKYFENYTDDIKKLFQIQPKYKTSFLENKKYLFKKKSIVIHLRRTDYLIFGIKDLGGIDMTLPLNYYKKCMNMIKNINDYNVIFVSDDINHIKKNFGYKTNYFFEKNDEITDFQILLSADILIIANSTFSWWAAWLNYKKEKVIYAPNYFLGFKINKFYPNGIKVDSWNWIDVN